MLEIVIYTITHEIKGFAIGKSTKKRVTDKESIYFLFGIEKNYVSLRFEKCGEIWLLATTIKNAKMLIRRFRRSDSYQCFCVLCWLRIYVGLFYFLDVSTALDMTDVISTKAEAAWRDLNEHKRVRINIKNEPIINIHI